MSQLPPPEPPHGPRLSVDELEQLAGAGQVDTVLLAFVDVQGRLQGKECDPAYFLRDMADHAAGACSYLLSVNVEMEPQEGFRDASWSTGFGDFHLLADLTTLRLAAWRPGTALCLADLRSTDGHDVATSPRAVLRRQLDRLAERGWSARAATELEFIAHGESYREAWERGYRDLTPMTYYNVDYSLLGIRHAGRLLDRIKRDTLRSGLPFESAKGEANRGQLEINFRHGEPLDAADDHVVFKHAVKEIALQEGLSVTFMAKWDEREGSSCHVHLSIEDAAGPLFAREREVFDGFLAGQLACMEELTLLFAPNVNSYKRFANRSFAPTAVAWGRDNRTCALRVVGSDRSLRIEHRLAGADVNPYLTLAAVIAGGLHGVDAGLRPPPAQTGDAYASDAPRVPGDLRTAVGRFATSAIAEEAFGTDVVAHYVRSAEIELESYEATVTDWERRRGYERL